ncbi:UNVERIFIED_CONTAM: hypothetical protein GTU68_027543, partial [Idotea baltica]|nr:hypothetical protein [Idotea baltica]
GVDILLLEDNVAAARSLGDYLEAKGVGVDYAYSGIACIELARSNYYDVLVLDVAMPGLDGLDACKQIRGDLQVGAPIIFLTARDTLSDKLLGFDAGADDYLVKPFAPEELLSRLKALAARGHRRDLGVQTYGDLVINYRQKTVTRNGTSIGLQDKQFKLLALLARNSPEVVPKEAMERELWEDYPPDSDALRTHLYRLRNLIDKPYDRTLIKTVHGRGYRLESD